MDDELDNETVTDIVPEEDELAVTDATEYVTTAVILLLGDVEAEKLPCVPVIILDDDSETLDVGDLVVTSVGIAVNCALPEWEAEPETLITAVIELHGEEEDEVVTEGERDSRGDTDGEDELVLQAVSEAWPLVVIATVPDLENVFDAV